MESHSYYRSLTRNMVLVMLLVSFTPLVLVSAIIGYQFETSYREKVRDHLVELIQKHQQNINGFLEEKLAYIQVLANSYTFEQLSDEVFLEQKLAVLQNAYGGVFVDLGVVNEQGMQIAYAGTFKLERADYADADWFKMAVQRRFIISDVFLGLRRQPHFIVAIRMEGPNGSWILRATIDFVAFNSLVESIHVGKTGTAFILNREGEFQTRPRLETPPNKEFFVQLMARLGKEGDQQESARISVGSDFMFLNDSLPAPVQPQSQYRDIAAGDFRYLDRDFIYVMTPLKSGEWILAYQQDAADAFADLHRTRKLVFLVLLAGGLVICMASLTLSRRMVQRIERADREKEMMNEQVIEAGKLASVGELAAGIAHEINNPVAVMVEEAGWMEDLLDEGIGDGSNLDEFQRALKQIKTQGARCKEITHKLLSFARKTDPKVRDVHLNDLIEEIVSISEQKARYSNVKINMHLQTNLPAVTASPSEMQQVFLNLINNAIDAIGAQGGAIDITTRREDAHVVVDVADTGSGIPKAMLGRIFDPFFTTKAVGKGTGLGLSICYGIIKKMGGTISVNSAVGVGTAFHVYLPVSLEEGN